MTEVIMADDLNAPETRTPEEIKSVIDAAGRFYDEMKQQEAEQSPIEALAKVSDETAIEFEPHKRTPAEMIELEIARQRFAKELPQRSFSGRNPELGPMIKCAQCGLRHRDNVKHDPIKYKEGTAQTEHGRPVANAAGWRAKPGRMYWIKELKKFVTINR